MSGLLVGTTDGLWAVEENQTLRRVAADGRTVTAVAAGAGGWVAVLDGRTVLAEGGESAELLVGTPAATCVAAGLESVLVGTAEAHLLRVDTGGVERVASFDEAEGRDGWYTPWGGPPDTRSLSVAADGTVYVNVHVGGILRSSGDADGWTPTIDVDADVHQVLAVGSGSVLAATAYGLARSDDRGATWTFSTAGLHGQYSRAVAVAGDWLLLSASTGPFTEQAAVYRRPFDAPDDVPFERCSEWFGRNVDTGSLVAGPDLAALAVDGTIFTSADGGATWRQPATGLGRITCVALVGG